MKVDGRPMRTLWPAEGRDALFIIESGRLSIMLELPGGHTSQPAGRPSN